VTRRIGSLALLLLAADAPGSAIEVDISGIRSAAGVVRVSVCSKAQFLAECSWSASAPARIGSVAVIVNAIPPGHYAVQAFHDADGDGKLGRNWLGLPREGVGFSNDAMAHLTYPRFSVAAFEHGAAPQKIAVRIRYFLG
jgi:uncharacterized protein (DUF2141 family)